MTTSSRPTRSHPTGLEVVVGLVNDGSATAVAAAAVHLANELTATIRFVQVVPGGLDTQERADAQTATFAVGLRALRHGKRRGATFESPVGDPGHLLVERSTNALALVVGEDQPGAVVAVANYCLAHARCPVHLVARDGIARSQDQWHYGTDDSAPSVEVEPPVATMP